MSALRRDDRLLPVYPYEPTTGEARLAFAVGPTTDVTNWS